jgi:hypothetical protein
MQSDHVLAPPMNFRSFLTIAGVSSSSPYLWLCPTANCLLPGADGLTPVHEPGIAMTLDTGALTGPPARCRPSHAGASRVSRSRKRLRHNS